MLGSSFNRLRVVHLGIRYIHKSDLDSFSKLATTARFARLRGSLRLPGVHKPFWNKILKLKLLFGKIQS